MSIVFINRHCCYKYSLYAISALLSRIDTDSNLHCYNTQALYLLSIVTINRFTATDGEDCTNTEPIADTFVNVTIKRLTATDGEECVNINRITATDGEDCVTINRLTSTDGEDCVLTVAIADTIGSHTPVRTSVIICRSPDGA